MKPCGAKQTLTAQSIKCGGIILRAEFIVLPDASLVIDNAEYQLALNDCADRARASQNKFMPRLGAFWQVRNAASLYRKIGAIVHY